mmetsp:Transcript_65376/g.181828  ORF Transcript_65376/g.181828 Transcript_65376/m.181828 type:complete len:188 (+) Transcript_65376:31-594(+)
MLTSGVAAARVVTISAPLMAAVGASVGGSQMETGRPWLPRPWYALTPRCDLDPAKSYLCVLTWSRVPLRLFPSFAAQADRVFEELYRLHGDRLVGCSGAYSPRLSSWAAPVAETVTVWHTWEAMSEFYGGPVHLEAMRNFSRESLPTLTIRRVWLSAADVPEHGDFFEAGRLYERIRAGEFPAAVRE